MFKMNKALIRYLNKIKRHILRGTYVFGLKNGYILPKSLHLDLVVVFQKWHLENNFVITFVLVLKKKFLRYIYFYTSINTHAIKLSFGLYVNYL